MPHVASCFKEHTQQCSTPIARPALPLALASVRVCAGVGLLLGSFGTLCVLIFGRPGAEPVRLWNILFGHAVATFIVLQLLHVVGASVFSRALAMVRGVVARYRCHRREARLCVRFNLEWSGAALLYVCMCVLACRR